MGPEVGSGGSSVQAWAEACEEKEIARHGRSVRYNCDTSFVEAQQLHAGGHERLESLEDYP